VKAPLTLTVNAKSHTAEVDTRTCLVDFLRDSLKLTGVHVGCRTGNCGACTIIMGGQTVKSCAILAADAHDQEITTIEALSTTLKDLHPIQQEFVAHQGLQCGFCTPGMILSVLQLLSTNPNPTDDEIRLGIAGNLCRCTGYHFIVDSIRAAARRLSGTRIDMTKIGLAKGSTDGAQP
jgi:aerobic carbon-monoxide dehydrogenase small subunit